METCGKPLDPSYRRGPPFARGFVGYRSAHAGVDWQSGGRQSRCCRRRLSCHPARSPLVL
eukprot:1300655-Pyramimonas_sp.AAC.1